MRFVHPPQALARAVDTTLSARLSKGSLLAIFRFLSLDFLKFEFELELSVRAVYLVA
jgi:hypothetical protein